MQPVPGDPSRIDFVLVNPAAGGGRAREVVPGLRKFAIDQCWAVEICVTESASDLAEKARCAARKGHRRLFVLGGDGTFQVLLNAVGEHSELVLGVIPAGGGNDLAAALGLSEDPIQAAAQLLQGETYRMDAVRVRTSEGNERLYAGGGGVGLDAEAARYASGAYRSLRGRFRYLLSAIRALFGFHAISVRISTESDEPLRVDAKVLVAGVLNTPSYGAGVYLAPEANTNDGNLELVLVEDLPLWEILTLLPTLWSSGKLKTKRVRRFTVKSVRIETEGCRSVHGDGEILGSTPVEISVVPQAFWTLRPLK